MDIATLVLKVDSTQVKQSGTALDQFTGKARKTETATGGLVNKFKSLKSSAFVLAGTAGLGAVIVTGTKAIKTFSALETGFIGVQKTTDFTKKEMVKFKKEIFDLSKKIPVATTSLIGISEAAGQLGIKGVQNVTKFTETMGKLELATDVVGEEGAKSIARLLNVTGDGVETIDTFGAVLVALGNNSAATESEILKLGTEVAQATSTFSVSSTEAIALGAAMKSMGVRAELGGSVLGRAMRTIEAAINEGGEAAQELTKYTGIAGDQLKDSFGKNATEVFEKWLIGVRKQIKEGRTAAEVMADWGLKGEEVMKVLPTLAINADQVTSALKLQNEELKQGTALNIEAKKATESLNSQWQLAKNRVTQFGGVLGEKLAPAVKRSIEKFDDWYDTNEDIINLKIDEYFGLIGDALVDIGGYVDKLIKAKKALEGIGEWGIIGDYLFGGKGQATAIKGTLDTINTGLRASLFSMGSISEVGFELGNAASEMWQKLSGKRDWDSGELYTELELKLNELIKRRKILKETFAISKAAREEKKEALASIDAQIEAIQNQQKAEIELSKTVEDVAEVTTASAEVEKQAAKDVKHFVVTKSKKILMSEKELADWKKQNLQEQKTAEQAFYDWVADSYLSDTGKAIKSIEDKAEALRKAIKDSGGSEDLIEGINEYEQDQIDKTLNEFYTAEEKKTNKLEEEEEKRKQKVKKVSDSIKGFNKSVIDSYVDGENLKTSMAKATKDTLTKYALEFATQAIMQVLGALGLQIGAEGALGAISSSTKGDSVATKLGYGAAYLAGAVALVKGGKKLGDYITDNKNAKGGQIPWVARNPNRGLIKEGTNGVDNVLLGYSPGTRHWGMKNEFVMNPYATEALLPQLEYWNRTITSSNRKYASGGSTDLNKPVSNPLKETRKFNESGFDQFVKDWWNDGLYSAIVQGVVYNVGGIAGMKLAKKLGANLFYSGGGLVDAKHGLGDFLPDWDKVNPKSIIDAHKKAIEDPSVFFDPSEMEDAKKLIAGMEPVMFGKTDTLQKKYGDKLSFGKFWAMLRDTPLIGKYIDRADKIMLPYFKAGLTPSMDISGASVQNSIKGMYEDLGSELVGGISLSRGTDYIPEDGMIYAHKGERITPAKFNASDNTLIAAINMLVALAKKGNEISDDIYRLVQQWNLAGLPPERA